MRIEQCLAVKRHQLSDQLAKRGIGIVFVSHFLDQVYEISDRITVLRNGAFVGEHPTPELPRRKLIEAMLGRDFDDESVSGHVPPAATSRHVLEARGLGRRGLLAPVDLDLPEGEVVGLAGLLGSGRTEVARLLFGLDAADSGTVTIEGKGAAIRSPRDAMARHLAFCSEDQTSSFWTNPRQTSMRTFVIV